MSIPNSIKVFLCKTCNNDPHTCHFNSEKGYGYWPCPIYGFAQDDVFHALWTCVAIEMYGV